MSEFRIRAIDPFRAELRVPGDKSISHRAILLAALSNGPCEIERFVSSRDCLATLNAVRALGVEVEEIEADPDTGGMKLRVHGCRGRFCQPAGPIDCANSGTTMRLLSGILAAQPFESELTGDASLSRRPMDRVAIPLQQMGAQIECMGEKWNAPLRIAGGPRLKAIHYESPIASSQVKSAILLAGLSAEGRTSVSEPFLSRDHTERMLKYLLVKTVREGKTVSIWGGQTPESRDLTIPGDLSSAAFWIVAAAAMPKAHLLVRNVGLNPTRAGILKALVRMGARINEIVDEEAGEPVGTIEVSGSKLKAIDIGGDEIPRLIDEVPILAVAAALAEGRTTIRDAGELRVKESDRISAVAENLRRMGVRVREFADGMEIEGEGKLRGAELNSLGDHRVAMAFTIAGLFAKRETVIHDTDCVHVSYPGFAEELKHLLK